MLLLGSIFEKYNILYHRYADDMQFYLPVSLDSACSLNNLFNCLNDIKCWMARNFLQLNEKKTEVIMCGIPSSVTNLNNALGHLTANLHNEVKNLGVFLDASKTPNGSKYSCYTEIQN